MGVVKNKTDINIYNQAIFVQYIQVRKKNLLHRECHHRHCEASSLYWNPNHSHYLWLPSPWRMFHRRAAYIGRPGHPLSSHSYSPCHPYSTERAFERVHWWYHNRFGRHPTLGFQQRIGHFHVKSSGNRKISCVPQLSRIRPGILGYKMRSTCSCHLCE